MPVIDCDFYFRETKPESKEIEPEEKEAVKQEEPKPEEVSRVACNLYGHKTGGKSKTVYQTDGL